MIQRIQSVYLLLVFCLMVIQTVIPFSDTWTVSLIAGIISIFALITIFLYKKRKLQIMICNIILLLLVLVYVFYIFFDRQYLPLSEMKFTSLFPLISGIFIYLAVGRIKKDEKLVRSLDRLR